MRGQRVAGVAGEGEGLFYCSKGYRKLQSNPMYTSSYRNKNAQHLSNRNVLDAHVISPSH